MPHDDIGLWGWGEVPVAPRGFVKKRQQVCHRAAMYHLKFRGEVQRHSSEHVMVFSSVYLQDKSALKLSGSRKQGSEIYHTRGCCAGIASPNIKTRNPNKALDQ